MKMAKLTENLDKQNKTQSDTLDNKVVCLQVPMSEDPKNFLRGTTDTIRGLIRRQQKKFGTSENDYKKCIKSSSSDLSLTFAKAVDSRLFKTAHIKLCGDIVNQMVQTANNTFAEELTKDCDKKEQTHLTVTELKPFNESVTIDTGQKCARTVIAHQKETNQILLTLKKDLLRVLNHARLEVLRTNEKEFKLLKDHLALCDYGLELKKYMCGFDVENFDFFVT